MSNDDFETLRPRDFGVRSFTIEDFAIRSDGDGRTVEAYAAVFKTPAEIRDQEGHYMEELERGSFRTTIATRGTNFGVFYNHARTIYGTPDGTLSVPIGVPLEVREDDKGVWTVTRYLDNPLADSVLDGIKQRAIRGQSFSGRFRKSARVRGARGSLPTIVRQEVEMREYGPTVFPAYVEAAIAGVRSVSSFIDEIAHLDPEDVDRLRNMLGIAVPLTTAAPEGTSDGAALIAEPAEATRGDHMKSFRSSRRRAREEGVLSWTPSRS